MNLVSFLLCLLEFLGYFITIAVAVAICILTVFVLLLMLAVIFDKVIGFLENWW